MLLRLSLAVLLGAVWAFAAPAGAQTPSDPSEDEAPAETAYEAFVARFQTEELRITSLIQVVPRFTFEETEGNQPRFEVARARLGIRGRLDNGIGYTLLGEFANRASLRDAAVSYGSDGVRASVGRQKTPFSGEVLTSDAVTDFFDRSRIVREVAPGRSIGAQLRATPGGGPHQLRAGVFNATQTTAVSGGDLAQRDRGGALLAARAQTELGVPDGSATLAANVAYNTDDTSTEVESPGKLDLGVDARVHLGRVFAAGEWIRSRVEAPYTATAPTGLDGGYVTLGVDLSPADRALARLDVIAVQDQEASVNAVLGYTRTLSRVARIQTNLLVPVVDAQDGYDLPLQLLFNFQIAF